MTLPTIPLPVVLSFAGLCIVMFCVGWYMHSHTSWGERQLAMFMLALVIIGLLALAFSARAGPAAFGNPSTEVGIPGMYVLAGSLLSFVILMLTLMTRLTRTRLQIVGGFVAILLATIVAALLLNSLIPQ